MMRPPLVTVVIVVLATAAAYASALRRELPFYHGGDERHFAWLAAGMARSLDPNPRWFGNPGSTLIYPLAALYRADDTLLHGGPPFSPSRNLMLRFREEPGEFYLIGRGLCALYAVLSLALLWLVGRRVFSEAAAAGGVVLSALVPLTMLHAVVLRTDSAGLFFGLLGLWSCLRLLEAPSSGRQIAAGATLGLAVATRYFLVMLIVPLLAVDALLLLRRTRHEARGVLLGLLAAPAAFAAVTPFFFLDFASALSSIYGEARTHHPYADGLSPAGNLLFYVGVVIPNQLSVPIALLAALGLGLSLVSGATPARLLAAFVLSFLVAISISPLHWARWVIPVLAPLALLAAAALERVLSVARAHTVFRRVSPGAGFVVVLGMLAAEPAFTALQLSQRQARATTRLLAREWLLDRLPDGARVVVERGSAPLLARQQVLDEQLGVSPQGTQHDLRVGARRLSILLVPSLAARGGIEDYLRTGFTHAVVASGFYALPLQYPRQFPNEAAMYRTLFERGQLMARFDPTSTRAGPTVQVLALPASKLTATGHLVDRHETDDDARSRR